MIQLQKKLEVLWNLVEETRRAWGRDVEVQQKAAFGFQSYSVV